MTFLTPIKTLLICLLTSSISIAPVSAETNESSDETVIQFEYEFDPYYSNISWYVNFDNEQIPTIEDDKEENIYKKLIRNAALPQYMLIEFSVNPLPVLGTYIKKNHETFYNDTEIENLNLIQALTAGFEEPYALSLFFGSVVQYTKDDEEKKSKNKGYMGYLLSHGDQHIFNNELINDKWYELEWKIKGDLDFENKSLSWSLRVGGKVHEHREIQDVLYFAVRRNHFNNIKGNWSWINNSELEYSIELHDKSSEIVQQQILITKKWGLSKNNKQALNFGIGLIQQKNKYTGTLALEEEEFRLIIRSNFQF